MLHSVGSFFQRSSWMGLNLANFEKNNHSVNKMQEVGK